MRFCKREWRRLSSTGRNASAAENAPRSAPPGRYRWKMSQTEGECKYRRKKHRWNSNRALDSRRSARRANTRSSSTSRRRAFHLGLGWKPPRAPPEVLDRAQGARWLGAAPFRSGGRRRADFAMMRGDGDETWKSGSRLIQPEPLSAQKRPPPNAPNGAARSSSRRTSTMRLAGTLALHRFAQDKHRSNAAGAARLPTV